MRKNMYAVAIRNAIAYGLMIFINWYVEYLPLGGVTSKEVSDSVNTLITPPGYVFSIWGIIYLLLLLFVISQFTKSQREKPYHDVLGAAFIVTCLLNSVWLVFFHFYAFWLNLILIILLCIYLYKIYNLLSKSNWELFNLERLAVYIPFSIYMAWVSIATLANLSIVLTEWGLLRTEWVMIAVTLIMLASGLAFILYSAWKNRDPYVLFVYLWAFIGLGLRYFTEGYTLLLLFTLGSIFILVWSILKIIRTYKR